uniref:flavodoxin family protein n=1 Tax=Desulfovibrio piger TaxID=901 RepID=UPI0026E9C5B8
MRILSLLGSPRANGTTHTVARLIAGGLSCGGAVEEIALREKHIRPCRGCQSCAAAPHACPLARTDDAEAVFAAIAAADVVLWTSPVYFYGLPAQAKALVDRSQRIWAGVEAGRPAGKGPLVLAAQAGGPVPAPALKTGAQVGTGEQVPGTGQAPQGAGIRHPGAETGKKVFQAQQAAGE